MEYLSPEGFRLDGRRAAEPRQVLCSVGTVGGCSGEADGHATFQIGNTKAFAYVYGPMEARQRGQSFHDKAALSCTLATAAFSTPVRTARTRGSDRLSTERALSIQQALEKLLLLEMFPRSHIRVFIQVAQVDGSSTAAAINAATLALADAGLPMRDLLVACTAGLLQGRPAVDLTREEENAGGAQVLVAAFASTKKISLLEVESKVPAGQFEPLFDASLQGCCLLAEEMRRCLLEHATQHFSLRASCRSTRKS
mmetsp:Transcript_41489/g.95373  ORF Transcript_41489/g.95373 Transcript_41489/m.95373 type:complete len:254 (-) Transcript_41489:41-802(-)